MKPIRVVLGAVPKMIESIMRDVLSGSPDITVVSQSDLPETESCDVVVLNAVAGDTDAAQEPGYTYPNPDAGIVIVESDGGAASVFKRLRGDLSLDKAVPSALERAIRIAAERS